MQETWVQSLGWDNPLEKGKATHSSILAWRIPGLYSPWDRKELDTTERLSFPPFSETTVEKLIWIGDLIAASLSLFKNFDCYGSS